MKKVIVSVTSDLVSDARVHKVCSSLQRNGCEVLLIGRKLGDIELLPGRIYRTKRFKLIFNKGFLFYAEYNIRLFFYLLLHRAEILVANDLDTLLPNFIAAWLKGSELYYDSHEYFTGVPELLDRPFVRGVWEQLERWIFPRLHNVYTVNSTLAKLFEEQYLVKVQVIKNVPELDSDNTVAVEKPSQHILLYQGAVNKDRGLEEMVEAMAYIDAATLHIVGDGDVKNSLIKRVAELKIGSKVLFINRLPFEELRSYTLKASLGLCIEKDTNINYRYCLPNKIFDYIHAGVPVLASNLVEIEKIISRYEIGAFIHSHDPKAIADQINKLLIDRSLLACWKENTIKARAELNWQEEELKLLKIFNLQAIGTKFAGN